MKRMLAVAALFGCVVCARAGAPVKPADVVHYRQSVMDLIGWNFGPLVGDDERQDGVGREGIRDARRTHQIAVDAGDRRIRQRPGQRRRRDRRETRHLERPRPISTQNSTISSHEAKALDETARGGDEAKMKEQFHKTADTCKACHDKYKAS